MAQAGNVKNALLCLPDVCNLGSFDELSSNSYKVSKVSEVCWKEKRIGSGEESISDFVGNG